MPVQSLELQHVYIKTFVDGIAFVLKLDSLASSGMRLHWKLREHVQDLMEPTIVWEPGRPIVVLSLWAWAYGHPGLPFQCSWCMGSVPMQLLAVPFYDSPGLSTRALCLWCLNFTYPPQAPPIALRNGSLH